MSTELDRLYRGPDPGELPVGGVGTIILDAVCREPAPEVLERVRSVLSVVATKTRSTWPSDTEWRELLPPWFSAKLRVYTQAESAEILAKTPRKRWHEIPWSYGSWLDSIKERVWQWWRADIDGPYLKIELALESWPYSVGALEYLIKAAGARTVSVKE
ncbi:MAG: hypothetical protein HYR55_09295 [Acidobacteria bacterium]|nr:hypothetical protein [Acidobacteriota bacterium]MBI3656678.1 hypothetical protein [Acidobacteriota bacterium]